jgi:ParB family chromosome partitioning protein
MEPQKRDKLRREIQTRGFLAPILVRPHHGRYQVVDGEHRFNIAAELGLPAVPCVVAQLDDTEARIKTLQLNGLRGENDPDRLAELIAELSRTMDHDSLAALLPWSRDEFEQQLALITHDAGQAVTRALNLTTGTVRPLDFEVFTLVVTAAERQLIEDAISHVRRRHGLHTDGEALALICGDILAQGD